MEIRDYAFPDSYLVEVDREAARDPATPTGNGTPHRAAGFSQLGQADFSYSFVF